MSVISIESLYKRKPTFFLQKKQVKLLTSVEHSIFLHIKINDFCHTIGYKSLFTQPHVFNDNFVECDNI